MISLILLTRGDIMSIYTNDTDAVRGGVLRKHASAVAVITLLVTMLVSRHMAYFKRAA